MPETAVALMQDQLLDPFRIGLLIALVWTMHRTEAVTGRWLPLAAGAAFVALIVPMTTGTAGREMFALQVASGLAANVVLLAVILAVRAVLLRARPGK